MKIELRGLGSVEVSFEHVRFAKTDTASDYTVANVTYFPSNGAMEYCRGTATCSDCDQYCKRAGRRLALTRALRFSHLPRQIRRIIWTELQSRGVKFF